MARHTHTWWWNMSPLSKTNDRQMNALTRIAGLILRADINRCLQLEQMIVSGCDVSLCPPPLLS